jgi:hypothetical protein
VCVTLATQATELLASRGETT